MKKTSSTKANDVAKKYRDAAMKVVSEYRIVIESRGEGKGFGGWAVEMPLVFGSGKTEADCIAQTRLVLAETVAFMLEQGEQPPSPAADNKREVQLNIRITPDERFRIAERARQAGFRSISDYIRRAALRGVG
jgi:predicted RNase H-like HicB family nuclease